MTTCIVTGCAFVSPYGGWVAGDLYRTSDGTFIFKGNCTDEEPDWIEGKPTYSKEITAFDFWEKRGIFVIESVCLIMNQATKDYLKNSPFLP